MGNALLTHLQALTIGENAPTEIGNTNVTVKEETSSPDSVFLAVVRKSFFCALGKHVCFIGPDAEHHIVAYQFLSIWRDRVVGLLFYFVIIVLLNIIIRKQNFPINMAYLIAWSVFLSTLGFRVLKHLPIKSARAQVYSRLLMQLRYKDPKRPKRQMKCHRT